jgi:ATP-dependent Clp protease adaptor protein ClpS
MPKQQWHEDADTALAEKTKPKTKQPPRYQVVLHNDDFTTMEFVVYVLQEIFHHDEGRAVQIMLDVHRTGVGVAGTYTFEIAETKAAKTTALAREAQYPLLVTVEPESPC